MQLWHHQPNNAKQCKSKLMRSHVATAHAIHAMPPSDSSERLQVCTELPCHASWKILRSAESADSNPVFVLEPCSGQRTIFKGGSKIAIHDFFHCFSSAERPLWTFPKSRHRLMGLCVSGSDLKRVTRLRHPVAPGTWESHQVWSSVEEADSSSAPVALGLADSRILSHKWHKCLKSSLKMIMISEDIWRCEMCPIFSSFGVYQLWTLVRLVQLVLWDHEGLLWKDFWCRCLRNIHWPDRWS